MVLGLASLTVGEGPLVLGDAAAQPVGVELEREDAELVGAA